MCSFRGSGDASAAALRGGLSCIGRPTARAPPKFGLGALSGAKLPVGGHPNVEEA